jgi:hypothetical protein
MKVLDMMHGLVGRNINFKEIYAGGDLKDPSGFFTLIPTLL